MSFSSSFLAHFTEEEQRSELVKIIALQGDNVDMALAEELNKRLNQSLELIHFPETRLRSWLSFLLKQVPNVKAASGTARVKLLASAKNAISISAGAFLGSTTGILFTQVSDLYLQPGLEGTISILQGEASIHTGTYANYISVSGTNFDLEQIKVFLGTKEIQPCGVITGYIRPFDGYYAFYFGEKLYIKIYPGQNTPYPEGLEYSVSVWSCEGTRGNINANSLEGYADGVKDIDGNDVEIEIYNVPIQNGASAPTRADLVNMLRHWFFVKTSVCSIPEYTAWYLNQAAVGDVIVEGDYERYLRSPNGTINVTGRVFVAALDRQGVPLVPAVQAALNSAIKSVKDIAIVQWEQPFEVKCYLEFRFQSCSSVSDFVNRLKSVANNFFNIQWLRERDMSLFEDLDFEDMRDEIGDYYNQVGLSIKPFHYYEDLNVNGASWVSPGTHIFTGENLEGFYKAYKLTDDSTPENKVWEDTPYAEFKQFPRSDGSADIFCIKDGTGKLASLPALVGYRSAGQVNFNGYDFLPNTKLGCYWGIKNEGILPIGKTYGFRTLAGLSVIQTGGANG